MGTKKRFDFISSKFFLTALFLACLSIGKRQINKYPFYFNKDIIIDLKSEENALLKLIITKPKWPYKARYTEYIL